MKRKRLINGRIAVAGAAWAILLSLNAGPANAAEVKVLSAVAVKSALDELAATFERSTGDKVTISYAVAGEVIKRVQTGESADVTILPKPRMDELVQQGKVLAGSTVNVASGAVGMAVRAGSPKPDISSPDAVKRSLLAAKSISYADPAKGGVSGIHFARVLERLGIADEMKPKTKLSTGLEAPPWDLAARGEVEIAVAMVPEILPVRGVDFVGPLPQELQNNPDFGYVAGILATATQPSAGKALIEFISGPAAAPVIRSKGLEPG
jgi:molybdate transport system substrate-binding protein